MVHLNQEMPGLEEEIVEAEAVLVVVTEAVASEAVVVSVEETAGATEVAVVVAEDLVEATKWEEEVTAETIGETDHTKRCAPGSHSSLRVGHGGKE